MIKFEKNVKKILPYNRGVYFRFLNDESNLTDKWYGLSFQLNSTENIDSAKSLELFERLFKNIILKFDNGKLWIVNHDDKDLMWFPNDENNLISLRTLFKQNNIPNTFKGALMLKKDDLLNLSRDLIQYPYLLLYRNALLYKNLDISHSELQFIIKISGHLNIDLLSTETELLEKAIKTNPPNSFIIKEYRGTILL